MVPEPSGQVDSSVDLSRSLGNSNHFTPTSPHMLSKRLNLTEIPLASAQAILASSPATTAAGQDKMSTLSSEDMFDMELDTSMKTQQEQQQQEQSWKIGGLLSHRFVDSRKGQFLQKVIFLEYETHAKNIVLFVHCTIIVGSINNISLGYI